jgi:AcrR family transcriptional regulator
MARDRRKRTPRVETPERPLADSHEAKQERSRRTQNRLLEAAEALLAEQGLEGATVPAIAERAELSVGAVYRRFPDKDALLRAVYERFFARSLDSNRAALNPDFWGAATAAEIVHAIVGGIVLGYAQQRGLLGALFRYAETHPDPEFRRRAEELNSRSLRALVDLLVARGERISHDDPDYAIRFAFFTVAAVLRAAVRSEPSAANPFTGPDERLAGELSRMCLAYLGLAADPPKKQASPRSARRPA